MGKMTKEQMKKAMGLCLAGGLIMVLSGCGSAVYSSSTSAAPAENYQYSAEAGGGYFTEDAVMEEIEMEATDAKGTDGAVDDSAASVRSERKLIKTVDMSVETKEFDLLMSTLEQQVNELGGYIENMDTYNGSTYSNYRSTRNASMTIRIPKDKLNSFLETVSGISNVVRRSENVEDVTLAYVDLESHKNALRTEQTRLLELLGQAETIEDILVIEQRLSQVRYELESMESQLRTYDNKVDYSTVYLDVDEVEELTPVVEETTGERIVNGFQESLRDIGEGMKEFGIWFIVKLPYLVIWAIVIVGAVLIILKTSRKKKMKRQMMAQPMVTPPMANGGNEQNPNAK